ncbi:MAG: hypothetical protein FWG39_01220 [Alphaproteobacteria bacterium]|nr:hypothetical protein [Alphaproteobacteria bacterium]
MSYRKTNKVRKKPEYTNGRFSGALTRAEYIVTTHFYKVYKIESETKGVSYSIIPKKHQGADKLIVKLTSAQFEALNRMYDVWDNRTNKR